MRLVLRVVRMAANHQDYGSKFARAVADLVQDGHFLTVIHGQGIGVQSSIAHSNGDAHGNGNHSGHATRHTATKNNNHDGAQPPSAAVEEPSQAEQSLSYSRRECAIFNAAENESRALIGLLAQAGIAGFGMHATDAGLVQLRRRSFGNGSSEFSVETARLHSKWLEIICSNKGVPVLSNLSSWSVEEEHLIDPDHMAAICAADWNADALIYVTEENGVPGTHGGILKWLDIESFNGSSAALGDEMRGRLAACAMALKRGVRRVRILPLSNIDCLSSFYFSSIQYGTEVIAAVHHM